MKSQDYINNWFSEFAGRFDSAVPVIVSEEATKYFKERFLPQNEDWDGVKWQALSPKYAKRKTRGKGRILTASTNLMQTIKPKEVNSRRVVISAGTSKVPYARIHNEGLTVSGNFKVKNYVNSNFMGKGKAVKIKSHTRRVNYKMPKRQFIGHSKFLNQILIDKLTAYMNSKK